MLATMLRGSREQLAASIAYQAKRNGSMQLEAKRQRFSSGEQTKNLPANMQTVQIPPFCARFPSSTKKLRSHCRKEMQGHDSSNAMMVARSPPLYAAIGLMRSACMT